MIRVKTPHTPFPSLQASALCACRGKIAKKEKGKEKEKERKLISGIN
jgi:hypothetical protein